jgi:hypothetical protein
MTAGQYLPAYDMTVRRSSDNAQTNIGLVGGLEDTATLAAFCSGTNAYLVTWKNQGSLGSAGDASQSTAASQPQVCASGVVKTWNGQPTVYYGGSQYLQTTGNVQVVNATTGVWSAAAVVNTNYNSTAQVIFSNDSTMANYRLISLRFTTNLGQLIADAFNATGNALSAVSSIYPGNLFGGQFNMSTVSAYTNGALGGTTAFSGTIPTNPSIVQPGGNQLSYYLNGTLSEVWAGGFVQSTSDKATYDLNAASFFGIAGVTQ